MKWREVGENCIMRNFITCTLHQMLFKEDEMGRACSTNGEKRNAWRILVGEPEGERPLGRCRWEDNIVTRMGRHRGVFDVRKLF
jgi:hypothetical protein